MQNPNEYTDEAYAAATVKLNSALSALWEAGATISNVEGELESALENAIEHPVSVHVEVND